jgi:hypothetical protein
VAVIANYDARAAVERELVLRLAALLWGLRRIIYHLDRDRSLGEPSVEAEVTRDAPFAQSQHGGDDDRG